MTTTTIGFAGLTHLGINSAAAAAAKGFHVVGFHPENDLIVKLNSGICPVSEPGLTELLTKHRDRITFGSNAEVLSCCDIVYIAIDVPTDSRGESDLDPIREIIRLTLDVIQPQSILVVLCQVPPGFTRSLGLEHERLYYQVETLIFGRAVERALHPERLIVGCANPEHPLPQAYSDFLATFGVPVLPMRYESAELAKISINMCLVASIGVANTMAELCEHIGADWSEIVPALKLDRRIGPYSYLSPGLGIAGGNLERDLATVIQLSHRHQTDSEIVRAWISNSEYRKDWTWRYLHASLLCHRPDAKIGILGLAYKEDTHSIKNSPSLALISHLVPENVCAFDPIVTVKTAGLNIKQAASPIDAIQDTDAVCVMTPWKDFREMDIHQIAKSMRGDLLIDPFRVFSSSSVRAAGLRHVTLGVSS
jgi:UDPglucose 6-dehydrogenase